jgi:microcystin-dependent protein
MSYNTFYNTLTGTSPGEFLPAMYPSGAIISNAGATADPSGWVICNGLTRNDNNDGKYNELARLGIGSGGSGISDYIPPNLGAAFLRGTGTSPISTAYAGPELKGFQNSQILSHTHKPDAHKHAPISNTTSLYALKKYTPNNSSSTNDPTSNEVSLNNTNINARYVNRFSTSSNVVTCSITQNVNRDDFESYPTFYTVNWILKL